MKTDTVKKNGNLNITEKYRNTEKLIANKKPKPMKEILDNYRYIEIKTVKKDNDRIRSIVRHKRLGKPIGKESSYEKGRCNTQSYYIPKSSNIHQMQKEQKYYNNKENSKLITWNAKIIINLIKILNIKLSQ